MCLRFMFLLTARLAAWLRLARREETWKTAEILILRHQLAVLQRQQPHRPKLNGESIDMSGHRYTCNDGELTA
jgi:putative transposase